MSKVQKAGMIGGSAIILAIGAFWFARPDPNSVSYHLNCIRSLERSMWAGPLSLKDYFRPGVWNWWLRHRPSAEQAFKQIDEHRQALIKLGYFQTREFVLTRRTLDRSSNAEFKSLLTNVPFTDSHWTWTTVGDRSSVVTVTARRQDMPVWSNIISGFDMKGAP
jgi:hypothetical protein